MTITILVYRVHAVQRMFERKISCKKTRQIFENGETIEDHSGDAASPSRLILGWEGKRPIHMVVSENTNATVAITVYSPKPGLWTKDFKRRR